MSTVGHTSRFAMNPPDEDRFGVKPFDPQDDIDVPDFDAPDVTEGFSDLLLCLTSASYVADAPIDPAEYAAHALIDALGTLDQEIAKVLDLPREQQLARANQLRKIMKRAWADVTRVTDNAGDKVDQILERLR